MYHYREYICLRYNQDGTPMMGGYVMLLWLGTESKTTAFDVPEIIIFDQFKRYTHHDLVFLHLMVAKIFYVLDTPYCWIGYTMCIITIRFLKYHQITIIINVVDRISSPRYLCQRKLQLNCLGRKNEQ